LNEQPSLEVVEGGEDPGQLNQIGIASHFEWSMLNRFYFLLVHNNGTDESKIAIKPDGMHKG